MQTKLTEREEIKHIYILIYKAYQCKLPVIFYFMNIIFHKIDWRIHQAKHSRVLCANFSAQRILLSLILQRVTGNIEVVGVIQKYSRPNDIVFSDD